MAKVKKNAILEGLSGRIGNLVFRQYGDQTVVSKMPTHNPQREPTPGEAHQQARIQEAAARAISILASRVGLRNALKRDLPGLVPYASLRGCSTKQGSLKTWKVR